MKVTIVKYLNPKGKVVEMRKDNFKGSYLPENIIEEYEVDIKGEGSAWYGEKDNFRIAVKQIKSLNDYTEKDGKVYIMEKFTDTKGISSYFTDGYHTPLQWLDYYRPATESEVLSLVYKPQQKISKETTSAESDRLKDLFLNDMAECLVENEQEFKIVYDFLDKNCDEELCRYLEDDGSLDYDVLNDEFPVIISASKEWGNIYEYDTLEYRDKNKTLIKFNGEEFWEVFE